MNRKRAMVAGISTVATVVALAVLPSTRPPHNSSCNVPSDSHVYNPQRLQQKGCVTVSGLVVKVRSEADGDYHYLFKLDSQYSSYLNDKNVSLQHGDLIIEEPCQKAVTQQDAINSCAGYKSPIKKLQNNTRYTIRGHFVTDTQHGWNEIHGISSVKP